VTGRKSEARAGILFASPWFIGFFVFLAGPLLSALYFSFCEYSVLKAPVWIGIDNYRNLVADELFWKSLSNTLLYALFAIPLGTFTAIGLAMLLNARIRGLAWYRTFFFLPSLVPAVPLSVLWLWMFNGDYGLINTFLGFLGVKGPAWLSDPTWSKPALVLMSVWGVGNAVVIYLAGLQEVPQQLYEAADLDGANAWQRTRNVTLPMLSPVILFNVVMAMIGSLQVFTQPYIMFPGGRPDRSTYFYSMYLYDNAFVYLKMGYASAMGWVMFLIILTLTMTALKVSERRVHYEGG